MFRANRLIKGFSSQRKSGARVLGAIITPLQNFRSFIIYKFDSREVPPCGLMSSAMNGYIHVLTLYFNL